MSTIPLNKFEKEEKVIELHKQGKTIRHIAPEVRMSFRDISKIIKAYDKKVRLKSKRETQEGNTQIPKKLSLSTQAFILYQEGKKIDEVKVLLDVPFRLAMRYWKQYLKSIRMEDCYEFYEVCQYDLPSLLKINNFMKRNNVSGNNIVNVLRTVNNIINLRGEMERLEQMKYIYLLNQNTNYLPLPRLGLPEYYYRY